MNSVRSTKPVRSYQRLTLLVLALSTAVAFAACKPVHVNMHPSQAMHAGNYGGEQATGILAGQFADFYGIPPNAVEQGYRAEDEYLCDGGDAPPEVVVRGQESIHGLNSEDTIAHFTNELGDQETRASNQVCIYAPRFAAVRKVVSANVHQQHQRPNRVSEETGPETEKLRQAVGVNIQPEQPEGQLGHHKLTLYESRQAGGKLSGRDSLLMAAERMKLFQDLQLVREGIMEETDVPLVREGLEAAIVWSHDHAVKVILNNQQAIVLSGDQRAQATFVVDSLPSRPELRIIKLASTKHAHPGDEVEFTIRFDNMGLQSISKIVIVDNLTPRLEFIEGSGRATHPVEFSAEPNPGGSHTLRWEFQSPLQTDEGGSISFRCRVR